MNAKTHEPLARPIRELVLPFPSVDWLSRRLNAGIIPGTKLGRTWVMSDDDVRAALAIFKNTNAHAPAASGITPASARRRALQPVGGAQ
ncbi:hypothetical protein [Mycolicibacterium celeriflavum]|uniref:Uncharacterized protein n=1 Tax=Mycolicibacterium celeriflavum TaxID=1249101 RepID=A0A1X0BM53_MYCCF|nr:hypothetical protein [Mycolicibacterium celeriflavum]MCV7240447.1 hypothetical protein [Mycolicibacterium celeriflavum]ORA43401.1 hypothetical protein BST21_21835 [Mycolicibacterium celeriflavum]BBY43591.1 hypothetical protein MCEL_18860 [Mycolicibacterium celeriflavum]